MRALPRLAPLLLLVLAAAGPARSQDAGFTLLDRGRLVVYHDQKPVATERFLFEGNADTLVAIAHVDRRLASPDGKTMPYAKSMTLLLRASDYGMLHYNSTETWGDHEILVEVSPNDTMLVIGISNDKRGEKNWLERPPGRFFALDPGIYTLFDVVARNLHGRLFGARPAEFVVLGEDARAFEATVAPAGADTVRWGAKRVVTQRMTVTDSTGVLDLWVSPEGHLLRFEDPRQNLVVMREPPAVPPAEKRRKPSRR